MALNEGLAMNAAAITPSDTARFSASAIFAGVGGTVVIEPEGTPGVYVTFVVPAGGYVLCRCTSVRAASSASSLIRLW